MDRSGNRILSGFVAVEGLDGAGTTTQVALIAERLRALGVSHFRTREPTDGPIGKLIRAMLVSRRPVSGPAFALLFAADRAEHCHGAGGIIERHAAGELVISDRCIASSLAYQSLEVTADYIEAVNDTAPLPRCVIFLTIPVELCQERLGARGAGRQRFDGAATQRRVLAAYDAALDRLQARGVTVHRIDGSGTREEVFSRLWPVLEID
jgi:dTMP kinase